MKIRPPRPRNSLWMIAFAVLTAVAPCALTAQRRSSSRIPQDQLIQPGALHRELQAGRHPLILQVGSRMLFDEAHIPGAEYAGPASTPDGLEALRRHVAGVPRTRPIVLYCGCCPWEHCPNIAPAWLLLHHLGFTRIRALYLAHNFGADWVNRNYGAVGSP
jgi:thiosulfate/3-mercaptopyruvate sulfurtransferase